MSKKPRKGPENMIEKQSRNQAKILGKQACFISKIWARTSSKLGPKRGSAGPKPVPQLGPAWAPNSPPASPVGRPTPLPKQGFEHLLSEYKRGADRLCFTPCKGPGRWAAVGVWRGLKSLTFKDNRWLMWRCFSPPKILKRRPAGIVVGCKFWCGRWLNLVALWVQIKCLWMTVWIMLEVVELYSS